MDAPDDTPVIADSPTEDLFQRAKRGEGGALDQLFARYLPRLRRWAHGRVPIWARDSVDTGDLVQETAIKAYSGFTNFEAHHKGALFDYLRRALCNRINDQFRHASRHSAPVALDENRHDAGASPLDAAIGAQDRRRYERAVQRLRAADRAAVVGRVDMGYSYEQLAVVLKKPTAEAARVAVRRALMRLKDEVDSERR